MLSVSLVEVLEGATVDAAVDVDSVNISVAVVVAVVWQ